MYVIGGIASIPVSILLVAVIILMILPCLLLPILMGLFLYDDISYNLTWREHTVPLSEKVVDDLCSIFELEADDERCDHAGDAVYGPDFLWNCTITSTLIIPAGQLMKR